jgi:hypothetical protein
MRAQKFAGILAVAGLLMTAAFSQAGNAVRIEPLDGTQNVTSSTSAPETRAAEHGPLPRGDSQPSPFTPPQGDVSMPATTPFGTPLPPNQLTPAPVLPFSPNRSLIPSSVAPSHPPNPARAETRANPSPYSGSGRLGR